MISFRPVARYLGTDAGDGFGTTVLSAGLDLKIPPPQAFGPYAGGLEITALTTGPGA